MQRHANGVVAWVMGLVGVLAVTGGGGCGNSGEAASETARLKEEVRSLREENVALKRDVFAANHKTGIEKDAVARLDRELAKLKKDHAQLEEDYTELAASIKPDGGAKEDAEKAKAKEKEKAEAARIAAAQAKAVEKVGEEAGSADENAAHQGVAGPAGEGREADCRPHGHDQRGAGQDLVAGEGDHRQEDGSATWMFRREGEYL